MQRIASQPEVFTGRIVLVRDVNCFQESEGPEIQIKVFRRQSIL